MTVGVAIGVGVAVGVRSRALLQSADEIAQRPGPIFYRDGSHDRIGRSVDDRDVVTESVGDVDPSAVRGYRNAVRGTPYRGGGHNPIGGGVDDRDVTAEFVSKISAASIQTVPLPANDLSPCEQSPDLAAPAAVQKNPE